MKLIAVLKARSGATADCSAGLNGRHRLEAHQRIENEKTADMEQQHGHRVGQPMLFALLFDAGSAIERQLDRP